MTKGVKSIVDKFGSGATFIDVQCHITNGLPSIIIIGHANKAVDEAKERLRASFAKCSIQMPKKRITINLSPADIIKDSTSLDLAMAAAVLLEAGQIKPERTEGAIFLGELSLDGTLNPVRGIIGRLMEASHQGSKIFYVPAANLEQALLVPDITVRAANSLRDVYLDLSGTLFINDTLSGKGLLEERFTSREALDFAEIAGQQIAKRALEVAAAGHHNILLHGPPGTGKTMLARAMCGILPDLEHDEVLEVTNLHSLGSGGFSDIISYRPFRNPHHTASATALIGGGTNPKPGEASLAHRGVLFLDELPEFSHSCLEALRQPLEDGRVTIARVKDSVTYPAEFILVATQNPCPCGYWGTSKPCSCSAAAIARYQKKVSGPILDRIDLHLPVHDIDHRRIFDNQNTQSESHPMKIRVQKAYKHQRSRFGKMRFNASMSNREIKELAFLSLPAKEMLDAAAPKLNISARAYVRTVKVARTIADLDDSKHILPEHIAEALQYRQHMNA